MENNNLAAILKYKVKELHCAMCQDSFRKTDVWRMYNGQFYHICCVQDHKI